MSLVDGSQTAYGLQEKPHDRGRSPPGPEDNYTSGRRFLPHWRPTWGSLVTCTSTRRFLCGSKIDGLALGRWINQRRRNWPLRRTSICPRQRRIWLVNSVLLFVRIHAARACRSP